MTPEQREAALRLALREAFSLGQTYWQQVDSESYSQKAKSEVTAKRFADLVDEICDAILRELLAAEPQQSKPLTDERKQAICAKARIDADAGWPHGPSYVALVIQGVERAITGEPT